MPTPSRRIQPPEWWPRRWTLLDSPPASALDNMATDLALLRRADASGRAVLRLYAWERPTVSFGRHEAVRGMWDMDAMGAAGLQVVRRPTGGRALLHAHDVTYSVTLPLDGQIAWRDAYDAVNASLLAALRSLNAAVTLSPGTDALSPNGALCFAGPSEGEIMLHDEKIAGSAVWRADGGYLQHGSILLHNAQSTLEQFRTANAVGTISTRHERPVPEATNAPSIASLRDTSGFAASPHVPGSQWGDAAAVVRAIRETWCAQARDIYTFEPSQSDVDAHTIARHELASPSWLWRR